MTKEQFMDGLIKNIDRVRGGCIFLCGKQLGENNSGNWGVYPACPENMMRRAMYDQGNDGITNLCAAF